MRLRTKRTCTILLDITVLRTNNVEPSLETAYATKVDMPTIFFFRMAMNRHCLLLDFLSPSDML